MFETTKTQGPDKVQGQEPIIEMNLGVIGRVHSILVGIVTHLKANRITDSEKRELEFDRDRRHEQLLEALKALVRRSSFVGPMQPKDKDKKGKGWLGNFMMAYGGWKLFKGFFKKFMKFLRIGGVWKFLRLAGIILSRLFWPLMLIGLAIWVIPKIIDAWPSVAATIKGAMLSIWQYIKDFLGFGDDDEAEEFAGLEGAALDENSYRWDDEKQHWIIGSNTIIEGVPQGREDVIRRLMQTRSTHNFNPEILPALIETFMRHEVVSTSTTPIVPGQEVISQTPMAGDIMFMSTPGADDTALEMGLDLGLVRTIAGSEGYREEAYQDAAGNWTVGYGHTGADVSEGDKMDKQMAADMLVADVHAAQGRAQGQMDAEFGAGTFAGMDPTMQSLATDVAFNVGNLTSSPKLMGHIASGNMAGVMQEYQRPDKTPSGVKMPSTGRNEATKAFLTTPTGGDSSQMSMKTTPIVPSARGGSQVAMKTTPAVGAGSQMAIKTPPSVAGGSQVAMQTTPATSVPGEDTPEIIVVPSEQHNTTTVPVVAKSSSKKIVNQQAFYSDPHYGHLGLA